MKTTVTRTRNRRKSPVHKPPKGNPFPQSKSIEELAREQGVKPWTNTHVLEGGFPPDEDIDAFLEEIYNSRR